MSDTPPDTTTAHIADVIGPPLRYCYEDNQRIAQMIENTALALAEEGWTVARLEDVAKARAWDEALPLVLGPTEPASGVTAAVLAKHRKALGLPESEGEG